MLLNKKLPKIIFLLMLVFLHLHIPNNVLASEQESQKKIQSFSPDSFEYQSISEEEAFELHVSEDEYEPSTIEEFLPIDENVMPQTGSAVTFCNEADCASVTVVFGGVSHPAYLSCYGTILYYNIPAGTYAWSTSGCGRVSTGYLYVDGSKSYTIRICPSLTQECCLRGCLSDGSYGCWQCIIPRTATSSIVTTTTTHATTTIPETTTSIPSTTIQPVPDTFSLSGYVTGDAISDISIQLKGSDSRTFVTNENGYYEFSDLENGYYIITPREKKYEFEPPNYVIQDLTSDLSYMDFVAIKAEQYLPCPSEVIYGEESEEINLLRYYRDNVLNKTQEGREYIKLYYKWSPAIVRAIEADERFQKKVKEILEGVLPLVREVVE